MQSLIRSKSAGVTGGRGTAGAGPGRDLLYYAVGAVLDQIRDDRSHVPLAFWSRILAEGQRRTWTAREKETYTIVCALRKWSGHIGLQPVVVCTDHQSLQSWHKEHVDTPSGPAARRA